MTISKKARKITAGLLSATMVLSLMGASAASVSAAAPKVTVDEATYVNMDYYGAVTDISVVKSCSLNGLTEFKDYGSYESVTNMSGYDTPELADGSVSWKLANAGNSQRFYYNCKMNKDTIVLPWNIDVSYKLNGVPCKAETLAGASGLVEIDIHVTPDDQAEEYFKNNMLLQAATYINTEDAYSIDAPGSQLQSVGTYKAVVFAALPGEEADFNIRIGTNSFETNGVTFMMIPGTLKQLEAIKSLKEAKDTIYDSAQAIYNSMDEILNTMDSMKSGIAGLKEGTEGLEDARSTFSAGKDQMNKDADQALADLNAVNTQLKNMIPYFQTARNDIKELNGDINKMIKTLDKLKKPLSSTNSSITEMQGDLKELQSMLNTQDGELGAALYQLGAVAQNPASGATGYDFAKLQGLSSLIGSMSSYSGNVNSLLSETIAMGNTTVKIINITKELIGDADNLRSTLDLSSENVEDFLNDCEKFASLMSSSIDSTATLLTYSKSLLQESGDKLDAATEKSLKSMTDLLDKSLRGLASVSTLRNANRTIKNAIDEQFDKIEKENRFLNLDANAELVSFTSNKNPAPESIQVILRTQEITPDKGAASITDLEKQKTDIGFLARLRNLFEKMLAIFM